MSKLWRVRVLDLAGDCVHVDVHQAHPDAGPFPDTRAFALRLLHEQAWDLGKGFTYRALGPLGEACDSKQVLDEDWVSSNVDRFIADVAVEGAGEPSLDEVAAVRRVAAELGLDPSLDGLSDEDRERFDQAYEALWEDASKLPVRRYRITVTEPTFLAHLSPGAEWASAAY